jgi:oxygen-dependent protoporphyrinogen oxidase
MDGLRSRRDGRTVIYGRHDHAATDPSAQAIMRVAIIGGGLAGLACAFELVDAGVDVTLLEAGDRFGGQVRTTLDRGFVVEEGADGFDPMSTALRTLIRDLRLADDVLVPEALPTLLLERVNGTRALRAVPEVPEAAAPAATLRSGMFSLVRGLLRRLEGRADLRVGNAAVAVTPAGSRWSVYPEIGPAVGADALVLALPPRSAAWLVHSICAPAARALSTLAARPLITVSLAYHRAAVVHPLNAAGFVVPRERSEGGLELCSFVTSNLAGRAPAETVLVRAILRPARGELVATTDDGWAHVAHAALQPVLGLGESPVATWVARWTDAIPVVDDRYRMLVREASAALRAAGLIELAGAAYGEPGLAGALHTGTAAARRLSAA